MKNDNSTNNISTNKTTDLDNSIASKIIELQDVHYQVPSDESTLTILKGCELSVQSNEVIAIIGRSGSGKSTLLSLMAGLEKPTDGNILLLDHSIKDLSEDQRAQIRAEQVGFIFQNFQLMPSMTALENVLMPLELFQIENAHQKALEALDKVGLKHRAKHRPAELSGGEQQRVAIARAFVTNPKVLFADEPTGNLDENTAKQIQELLFELNSRLNTTLVIVTHDKKLAGHCQKVYELIDGKLEEV